MIRLWYTKHRKAYKLGSRSAARNWMKWSWIHLCSKCFIINQYFYRIICPSEQVIFATNNNKKSIPKLKLIQTSHCTNHKCYLTEPRRESSSSFPEPKAVLSDSIFKCYIGEEAILLQTSWKPGLRPGLQNPHRRKLGSPSSNSTLKEHHPKRSAVGWDLGDFQNPHRHKPAAALPWTWNKVNHVHIIFLK